MLLSATSNIYYKYIKSSVITKNLKTKRDNAISKNNTVTDKTSVNLQTFTQMHVDLECVGGHCGQCVARSEVSGG